MNRKHLLLTTALALLALSGCGGGPVTVVVTSGPPEGFVTVVVTPGPPEGVITVVVTSEPPPLPAIVVPTETPPPAETAVEMLEAVFAHGLTEQMEPQDPGTDFAPDEAVYLSVKIKGRPKAGVVAARFFLGDALIVEGSVDLADVNSGVLFSVGENTYAGYSFTHTDPLPISDNYHADILFDGVPLGSAGFQVVPPEGAIPSQIAEAVLAKGTDADYNPLEPATTFAVDQEVFLVGRGDLGIATWIEARWYVNGQLDESGTRSLTLEENYQDVPFSFSFLPEGGWPLGGHWVVLVMNDREVGRYDFTVQ
ncbi:MAG TPA: hypothetical protein PKO09_03125 [Anaerolineae bacterium]|nr:hypothetical protein [Anaerolineae bacterium]